MFLDYIPFIKVIWYQCLFENSCAVPLCMRTRLKRKRKKILQQYINNGGVVELGQIAHSQQLQTGAESAGHVVISRLQFARISHIS